MVEDLHRRCWFNKGFSAMLADEYILIVPLSTQLLPGLNE
jgi:hypothetical protein